ncbi:MAG: hypothetical protein II543_01105 [Desulfovibrio sp.]|nr:hypothetical protein [Desulfovibrio sp.]
MLGTQRLKGAGFTKDGVTCNMTVTKDQVSLVVCMKASKMLKGAAKGGDVHVAASSGVFFGDAGNDIFRTGNDRDCAVSGKEAWGQDRITQMTGTLAIVFKDLKVADLTSILSDTTMTVTKTADARQSALYPDP